jgi:hypothetical protein
MTRSLHSFLCGGSGGKPGRLAARRPFFVPCMLLLEDRILPSVQFTPAPYAVPANRPDTPLTHIAPYTVFEPYLSVSPADPGDIAVSSQNGIRVSTTAGGNFTGGIGFPGTQSFGDTSTVYDSAGRLFWVNLTSPGGLRGISIDQVDPTTGTVISQHVVDQVPDASFSDDKDFIAADPSNNNLYVIWARGDPSGDPSGYHIFHPLMSYSSDQGASWSAPVQVDNGSDNFAWPATVTIAPDHMVYATYHSVSGTIHSDGSGGNDVPSHDGKIVVVRFNNDLTDPVRSIAEVPGRADVTFNIQTAGFARQIPGATFLTIGNMQPWVLADPVRPGNIYVISADSGNGSHQDYGDIRIARSTDYGLTWSSSLIETSSTLFPNAAIDEFGNIVVAWYDNRRGLTNVAGHFKLDVYATYSTDGGLTFAPAFPVNDQTPGVNTPNGNVFDPDPGTVNYVPGPPPTTRMGEYFGLGIWGGTAYVAWNGNRFEGFNNPIDEQVWTKAFAIRGSLTVTAPPGDDLITIRSTADNPNFVEVIVNGQRHYAGLWSALTGITVNDTGGTDLVAIEDTVAGTPVTVNRGSGADPVWISTSAGDLGTIQGPVIVHGGSGTGNVQFFDFNDTTSTTYTITGSSVTRTGSAAFSYDNITGMLFVNGGSGHDTYTAIGTFPNPVIVNAGSGSNTLNIDDGSTTANTTYTITDSSVARTGSGTISYGNVTNLVLTGGSGNNTYNVQTTPNLSSTTINTGSGADTVNVQGTAGPLLINSGSGGATITLTNSTGTLGGIGHVIVNDPFNSATVTVDDSGFTNSSTYTVTSSQVAATAWPNFLLVYNSVATLNLNGSGGDDSFEIESTSSPTATTVSAGNGSNRFDITPTNQYLAAIAGPLTLVGGGGDTLVFSDKANLNEETYTFDNIPSMLALLTVPAFATNWSGMAAVYLETNEMSTVIDPSGTVLVDTPPPGPPPSPAGGVPRRFAFAGQPALLDLGSALVGGTSAAPGVSEIARIAPLAAPPLLDWLFASPTREELGGAALGVPLVNEGAQRPDPWQLHISDLNLLEYTL